MGVRSDSLSSYYHLNVELYDKDDKLFNEDENIKI